MGLPTIDEVNLPGAPKNVKKWSRKCDETNPMQSDLNSDVGMLESVTVEMCK